MEKEQQNRMEALAHAVRNPVKQHGNYTADEVVKDAEKYFAFLQGAEAKS